MLTTHTPLSHHPHSNYCTHLHAIFALTRDSRNQWCYKISVMFLLREKKGNLMVLQVLSGNLLNTMYYLSIYLSMLAIFYIFYATAMLRLFIYSSSSSSEPLASTVSSSLSLSVHNSGSSSRIVMCTTPFVSMFPTASLPYCE